MLGGITLLWAAPAALGQIGSGSSPDLCRQCRSQNDLLAVDLARRRQWPLAWEAGFRRHAQVAIDYYADQGYGNTTSENEKQSYPLAMFAFLAGDRHQALACLQSEDDQAFEHRHTAGIDDDYAFTLKGQIWGQ